jgi:hypothetical protein
MTYEQTEYIAEMVADIAKNHRGSLVIHVIPPQTATSGHLDFAFAVEEKPTDTTGEGERSVFVRVVR